MSTPTPDKSALPDPSYHWTTRKACVFLGALAEFGRVGEAARAVGMSRQSAYRLRERLGGLFAESWDRAQGQGLEKRRARRRAARNATSSVWESDDGRGSRRHPGAERDTAACEGDRLRPQGDKKGA